MSPARRLMFLCLALAAVVLVVGIAVPRLLRADATVVAVPQDQPGTVVLVPGYGGSTASLQVLARELAQDGRDAVVVDLPGDGTGDLRESAAALDGVVAAAIGAGARSVDVVGYSAGGVTARYWLRELGGAALTRRVITLGSPSHGTGLARQGAVLGGAVCPTACQQLVPGSDLLDDLNRGDETPDGPVYLALWTDQDETVTPPDSARLEGAVALSVQDVCPGRVVSHGDLPRDRAVSALVRAALGTAALEVPSGCPV